VPIVSEKSERSRRVPHRWLAGCGVLLGLLLLLLLLVPFVTPVGLILGDVAVDVYTVRGAPPQPLSAEAITTGGGRYHHLSLSFGRLGYGVLWSRRRHRDRWRH
jgi:uncharacterized SAM-binding protein YcdF (DUF218 family)